MNSALQMRNYIFGGTFSSLYNITLLCHVMTKMFTFGNTKNITLLFQSSCNAKLSIQFKTRESAGYRFYIEVN
jgi:hypothetical protein